MSLNEGAYSWNIQEARAIQKITNGSETGESVYSPVFEMAGLEWRIKIYPNGMNADRHGSFDVFLVLCDTPTTWKHIMVFWMLTLPQTFSGHSATDIFVKRNSKGWRAYALRLEEVKALNLNNLRIDVQVKIIQIRLHENDAIYYHLPLEYKNRSQFTWTIEPAMQLLRRSDKFGKKTSSELFDSLWTVKFAPNGDRKQNQGQCLVYLALCWMPRNINVVKIQWTASIPQLKFKRTQLQTHKNQLGRSMAMQVGTFSQFQKCQNLSVQIDTLILSEFDKDGKETKVDRMQNWAQFVQKQQQRKEHGLAINELEHVHQETEQKQNASNHHEFEALRQRFESYQTSMNQKIQGISAKYFQNTKEIRLMKSELSQQISDLSQTVHEIQQTVQLLTDEELKTNEDEQNKHRSLTMKVQRMEEEMKRMKATMSSSPRAAKPVDGLDAVRAFFETELNLPQYAEVVIENGFESMQSLLEITNDDLKEMDVKVYHRKIIMKSIDAKKPKDEDKIAAAYHEGGTAYI